MGYLGAFIQNKLYVLVLGETSLAFEANNCRMLIPEILHQTISPTGLTAFPMPGETEAGIWVFLLLVAGCFNSLEACTTKPGI